ncbi:MAG TPA: fluoride efflux transporter CrcB [Acidobacteriaceae bacterium]|nr:fluoride efflux transporter CrcB [Acidobacteriaceae bacterium]
MQKYLYIAIGGALGSIARFWVGSAITNRFGAKFYYGTFLVNLSACLILGFSLAILNRRAGLGIAWRFLIPVGFIGAYSTFSTFEWEALTSLRMGAFVFASVYVAASVFLGLAAAWCGLALGDLIA